jgi:hypothetical protein
MYKLSKSSDNVSFPASSNAYGAKIKIVRLSLCKETQTISLAGKELIQVKLEQTTETLLPFHDGSHVSRCIKTSKSKSLRRFKYIGHPLFKALNRYTRRKYKTKIGKTRNSGFLDRIEKK